MNQDLLAQAKQRLPLSALMAQLGFGERVKKSSCCPFHEDSSASFSVYPGHDGEERWKCFAGCGEGDAIDFLAKHRGIRSLGYVMSTGIATCMIAGLTFLPALLNLFSRRAARRRPSLDGPPVLDAETKRPSADNALSTLGREEPR